ncbi:hypothetical protein D1872_229400 [compost metagenome]
MGAFGIDDVIEGHLDQPAQAAVELGGFPDPVQIGVRLQNMKVSIHGLFLIQVLVAKAELLGRLPIAGESLEIPLILVVVAVFFEQTVQLDGPFQRFLIAVCAIVFG